MLERLVQEQADKEARMRAVADRVMAPYAANAARLQPIIDALTDDVRRRQPAVDSFKRTIEAFGEQLKRR
jgi:hypothetical protein